MAVNGCTIYMEKHRRLDVEDEVNLLRAVLERDQRKTQAVIHAL